MVRNSVSFSQAANDLKLPLSPTECEKVVKRKEFQQILRQEKNAFRQEVANEPGRTKSTAVGMMVLAIENLITEGEWDKAVAAIEKLAKLEGWLGAESNVNIFAGMTARDIATEKERILKELHTPAPAETSN